MLKMMVFVALTGLTFTHAFANADEKGPYSEAILSDSYRTSKSDSLVMAQNSNTTKDATPVQKSKPAKSISEDEAKQIAEKAVPGKVTDVTIEKKYGANRFVVEVAPAAGGQEVDVVIDMTNGKILGIEK